MRLEPRRPPKPPIMRGPKPDAARELGSDQGGAGAPPDREPRRAEYGVAAAVSDRAAGPARPGAADGRDRLPPARAGGGRAPTRIAAPAAPHRRPGLAG